MLKRRCCISDNNPGNICAFFCVLEILLLCMGYNLNKLHAKIQNGRTGSHLFPGKKTA